MPYNHMYYRHRVAPRVGAWIETTSATRRRPPASSLPVWERGLKHSEAYSLRASNGRSPCGSVD